MGNGEEIALIQADISILEDWIAEIGSRGRLQSHDPTVNDEFAIADLQNRVRIKRDQIARLSGIQPAS